MENKYLLPVPDVEEEYCLFVGKDKTVLIRGRRFVFVVVSVWCDILNHSNVPFLLLPPQSCSVKYITGAEVSSNLFFIK